MISVNDSLGHACDITGGYNYTCYTHMPNGTGQVIGETIGSTSYYYLPDLQDSTVGVTDTSGNVADTYSYDPYGNLLSSTGTVANPYRYDDGYYDSATGLYRFGQRYYNPADARWTQLDPSGDNPGYLFANDNPANEFDPTGTVSLKFLKAGLTGCAFSASGYVIVGGSLTAATAGTFALPSLAAATYACLGGAGGGLTEYLLTHHSSPNGSEYDIYKALRG